MDNNKENVETQSTIGEKTSTDSNVKTPLVDALRAYFKLNYDVDGFPTSYPDPI